MGFRFLTLDGWLETESVNRILFLLGEVIEHEEIRQSAPHVNALKHAIDLLKHPHPRAWYASSDSDTLRCPLCLARVPGGNPWREGDRIRPMNIFAQHGDTIYADSEFYQCGGCGKWLTVRNLYGEVPYPAMGYAPADEVQLVYVGDEENERMNESHP